VTAAVSAAVPARRADDVPRLFHYTCSHAAPSIVACGALVPYGHPLLPRLKPLVWLSTLVHPEPGDIGFSDELCDRVEWRFQVIDTSTCLLWWEVANELPAYVLPARIAYDMENGRRSDTWWVSASPVPVVLA
jgi:hypothetical protein